MNTFVPGTVDSRMVLTINDGGKRRTVRRATAEEASAALAALVWAFVDGPLCLQAVVDGDRVRFVDGADVVEGLRVVE